MVINKKVDHRQQIRKWRKLSNKKKYYGSYHSL